jgi:phage terminase large subunit-like protein
MSTDTQAPVSTAIKALDYAMDVLLGEIPSCEYVKLACQRFVEDLKREDVWYDEEAAQDFYTYCTYLHHYKGPWAGKPIELEPWQLFFFGNVYGFKKCELVDDEWVHTDEWRFKYNYLEVPRKNGKTTIAAAGATYDARYMEATGAEVYCAATKEDQAAILYNDAKAYINKSEDMKDEFEILHGRNTIYAQGTDRTSFLKPLGSDSQRQDGLNPFAVYCDEFHAWPDRALLDVLEDAFGARTNWHIVQITTAGHNRQGVCFKERAHLIEILRGIVIKDDKFGMIFTIDKEDKDNWMDEAVWFKANPNLGRGKQLAYMRSKAEKAQQIPSELNTFLTKQLNVWTEAAEAWLLFDTWKKCRVTGEKPDLRSKKCIVGVDLAKVRDLSAVAYLFPVQPGILKPYLRVDFYCPGNNIQQRVRDDKVSYDVWAKGGYIKETRGDTTDFDFIEKDIVDNSSVYDIQQVMFDRTFAGEIINHLMDEGLDIETIAQNFFTLGPATSELERLLVKGDIDVEFNPVLDWCAANVVVEKDSHDNIKPDKAKSQEKIDGIAATINALAKMIGPKTDRKKPSPYEKRGMRSVG